MEDGGKGVGLNCIEGGHRMEGCAGLECEGPSYFSLWKFIGLCSPWHSENVDMGGIGLFCPLCWALSSHLVWLN